jgi:hypothetical protein
MNKASLTVFVSLWVFAGAAHAQEGGVRMSTDPAKAADVEQRAQALQAQQEMHQQMPMQHKPMHHHKKGMKHEKEGASQ